MKHSLRSLMKFSIRDLMLLTLVVALAVWWWTERSRLQRENWKLIRYNAYYKALANDEHNARVAASEDSRVRLLIQTQLEDEIKRLKSGSQLPNAQAPAPNPRED